MKKYLLILWAILTITATYSQKTKYARWSLTFEGGYDRFDGDVNQRIEDIVPTAFQQVTWGSALYYNMTPVWALCLDYYYLPLRAQDNAIAFHTVINTLDLNVSINFTKLIFPQTHSKLSFCGSLGIGAGKYNSYYKSPDPINSPERVFKGDAVSCPVTFFGEWNFSKPFSVGARIHYRAYNKDNFEGDYTRYNYKGVTNDYIAALTAFIRIKFMTKGTDHIRNISAEDYFPNPTLELAKATADRLTKLEKKVDGQGARIDSIAKLLSNDGPDSDNDGVPDFRDKSPNTAAKTAVNFWGIPLIMPDCLPPCNTPTKVASIDNIPSVYFDFDKIDLDDDALVTIRKISLKLKSDSTLMVEVRGYCDVMGSNPYNNLLSQRRADRVKAELVKAWGISPDRIIPNGKGRIVDQMGKYRPNRRCDFFFNK